MFCLGNNDGRDMLKKFWHDDGHDDDGKKLCVIAKALVTELKRATMLKFCLPKQKNQTLIEWTSTCHTAHHHVLKNNYIIFCSSSLLRCCSYA